MHLNPESLSFALTSSRAAASGEEEKLSIGVSTSLAAGGMRALILELIQTLPGVQLSGFERGRRRLSQALRQAPNLMRRAGAFRIRDRSP